jgi:polysaccharide export outer membrane protein
LTSEAWQKISTVWELLQNPFSGRVGHVRGYCDSRLKYFLVLATGLLWCLSVWGCQGTPAMTRTQMAAEPPVEDVFLPGDEVEVKFTYTPRFNEIQKISPEGTISLQLIGEVRATGKTRAQLRQELIKLYSPLLIKPDIMVLARKQMQRKVYVAGEVMKPGLVAMPGPMTVLQALMEAGGPNMRTATTRHIVIIRQKNGQEYGCVVDLRGTLEGNTSQPFFLEPLDVVYVPRSGITKVNQWIDQYVNKMVPQTGASYFTPIGPAGAARLGLDTSNIRPGVN